MAKRKRANNDQQNTTQKPNDWFHEAHCK